MSKKAARDFYEKIHSDPALAKQIQSRGAELTGEDLLNIAQGAGFECTAADIDEVGNQIAGELSEEALDQVSGGTQINFQQGSKSNAMAQNMSATGISAFKAGSTTSGQ